MFILEDLDGEKPVLRPRPAFGPVTLLAVVRRSQSHGGDLRTRDGDGLLEGFLNNNVVRSPVAATNPDQSPLWCTLGERPILGPFLSDPFDLYPYKRPEVSIIVVALKGYIAVNLSVLSPRVSNPIFRLHKIGLEIPTLCDGCGQCGPLSSFGGLRAAVKCVSVVS